MEMKSVVYFILFTIFMVVLITSLRAEECHKDGNMDGNGIVDTDDWDATDYGDTNEHGRGDGVPDCEEDTD
ncbi:MAG: hypothetical protein BV456_07630 [Thermoplasmata archaeon M8B2D]|nr:MAG: hypothetical protein BV456_07630 [Thermoplasmata archaeon M8B2D]